jgi:hypothetical protein
MKKTLLIAAAALAAGVISSQAQVYSQNIVGYVNVATPSGYVNIANPLSTGNGDSATNFFDIHSGNQDGTIILQWTGTGYSQVQIDSTTATGFSDPTTSAVKPAPVLNPGKGIFVNNQTAAFLTNITFVGSVLTGGPGASTNTVGIVTNTLASSPTYNLVGSVLPIAGGITSVLQLNNPGGAIDGTIVLTPTVVSGQIRGYVQVQFDSSSGTGFSDPTTSASRPEPTFSVGQSFFINNQSGAPITWVQSL